MKSVSTKFVADSTLRLNRSLLSPSVADSGWGSVWPDPPPPPKNNTTTFFRPDDVCLRRIFLYRQDRISLFNLLIFFLMKRALHFATKVNSRDIKKCNCFWVPSCDLLASSNKAVYPAPKCARVHRLRNTWLCLWELISHKNSSTVLSEPKFGPPIKSSWIHPWTL